MADNPALRGGQDRSRIDVNEKHELAYWTKKFRVSRDELKAAVADVGPLVADVEKRFDGTRRSSSRKTSGNGVSAPAREASANGTAAKKVSTGKSVAAKKSAAVRIPDAINLLRADHKRVSEMFDQFEKTRSTTKKKTLVSKICLELSVHAQIEEEIFYPAVKGALRDKEMIPEATVEHASVRDLIAQVRDVEPDGEMYDAKVTVMGEFVRHHVKEEQNEMFAKAKKTRLDMAALGEQLYARQQELMSAGG